MIDVARATLDVIEAVKTKQVIKFDYGQDVIREVKPTGFFGDFDGFEGTDESTNDREFRRFRFDKIQKWMGVQDKFEEIDNLKIALSTAIEITKEAKGLSYPVVDIQVKLSNLIRCILSNKIRSIKAGSLYENMISALDKSKLIPLKYLS